MGRDLRRKGVKVVRRYSEALKRQVVLEYESGESTGRELVEQYAIGCPRTITRWCRRYGQYHRATKIVRVMMKSEQERIRELERTVADLTLENRVLQVQLQLWEEEGDKGLKKKLSTEQLKKLESLKAKLAAIQSGSSVDVSE